MASPEARRARGGARVSELDDYPALPHAAPLVGTFTKATLCRHSGAFSPILPMRKTARAAGEEKPSTQRDGSQKKHQQRYAGDSEDHSVTSQSGGMLDRAILDPIIWFINPGNIRASTTTPRGCYARLGRPEGATGHSHHTGRRPPRRVEGFASPERTLTRPGNCGPVYLDCQE